MNAYPYAGRDLFVEPENYFFASCANADYLEVWEESRTQAMGRLVERASAGTGRPESGGSVQAQLGDPSPFEHYLEAALFDAQTGEISSRDLAERIEPYVGKYEVYKRLRSRYGADDRRHPEAQPAGLHTYVLFAQCLAFTAKTQRSLKHLSCLLKLCDALASKPASHFLPADAQAMAEVMGGERALVGTLERCS